MTRNLLVVLLGDASLSELRSAVEARADGLPKAYVVAPAHVGPLHWLATNEQAAREEAGVRALEAEWILSGVAAVGGEAGEADPTLAVEDALRRFPAEEILLVGGGAANSVWGAFIRFRLQIGKVVCERPESWHPTRDSSPIRSQARSEWAAYGHWAPAAARAGL